MRSRKIICVLLCGLLLLGAAPAASAAGLKATVATGPVVLNGQPIENATAEYPLLVYKDITYFPMTYYLCRFLGLTTQWDATAETFSIVKTGETGQYVPDTGHSRKSGSVSVTRVAYPVSVNGTPVDNSKAEWPLLNYNNITYFPLTWVFAAEAFGWDYKWDAANGLRINSTSAVSSDGKTIGEEMLAASRAWAGLSLWNPSVIELDLDSDWTYDGLEKAIQGYLEAYYQGIEQAELLAGRLTKVEIGLGFSFPEDPKSGDVLTVPYSATYSGDPRVLSSGESFTPTSRAENMTAQVRLTGQGVTGDSSRPGQEAYQRLEACTKLTGLTGSDAHTAIFNAISANLTSAGLADQYGIKALVTGRRSGQSMEFQVTFTALQGDGADLTISGQAAFAE